jgi:quinol monooxygenase YgiN
MPRVVIHGSAHLNAQHVEDFKAYLKKLTALSLAEEGCDAYISALSSPLLVSHV